MDTFINTYVYLVGIVTLVLLSVFALINAAGWLVAEYHRVKQNTLRKVQENGLEAALEETRSPEWSR